MRAAVIDRGGEVLDSAKTEGAMADQFDLVVHALHGSIGDTQSGPSQDAIEMRTQHANQFFEGLESRAHRGVHPALQMLLGPSRLAVRPEELKSFLEVVSPDDGRVPAYEGGEALFLLGPKVPGILQQQEASLLEGGLLPTAEEAHFAPPDFIHGPV